VSSLTFLPWLRRGLAQHIVTPKSIVPTAMPSETQVQPFLTLAPGDEDVPNLPQAIVRGPGHVLGVHRRSVARVEPARNAKDAEGDYVAFIELVAPDLPWMFTPAAPLDSNARLMPWLVLVVVEDRRGVQLTKKPNTKVSVLTIHQGAAEELWDLSKAWAWAHVQSKVGNGSAVQDAVVQGKRSVIARLLCPRVLEPERSWIACVVPAFDAGRLSGLGEPFQGSTLDYAWKPSDDSVELPVYYSWRFSTAPAGSFKELAERLSTRTDSVALGLRDMDVSKPGSTKIPGHGTEVLLSFEGVMKDPLATPNAWVPGSYQATYEGALESWLNEGTHRLEYQHDALPEEDPMLAPPLYGAWQAGVDGVPTDPGWLRELNLNPVRRAAAGLGAEIVRRNQEAFMAAAWDEAGDARHVQATLSQESLKAEVNRTLNRRFGELDDGTYLQVSQPVHRTVKGSDDTTAIAKQFRHSQVPDGLLGHAFMRATRPGTASARAWDKRRGREGPMMSQITQTFAEATSPTASDERKDVLKFAVPGIPGGMCTDDVPPPPPPPVGVDMSQAASLLRSRLDPVGSVRTAIRQRLPDLGDRLPSEGAVPTRLPVGVQSTGPTGPVFQNALFWKLLELGQELVLPGVGDVPDNTLRLLTVNAGFVASLLAGANSEMVRELIFREYPADPSVTVFRNFWESQGVTDPASMVPDVANMHEWSLGTDLSGLMLPAATPSTVILIKGELLRRFPKTLVYLIPGMSAEPGYDMTAPPAMPVFFGQFGDDVRFFGFDVPSSDAIGTPGYWLVLEEPSTGPRFGPPGNPDPGFFQPQPDAASSANVAVDTYRGPVRILHHLPDLL